jgi:hypothetical protein
VNGTLERQPPAAAAGVGQDNMVNEATAEAASQRILIVHTPLT